MFSNRRTFILQCVLVFAMVVGLISMIYLSVKVSDIMTDETVKTIVNYLTSYLAILSSMMAFTIITLFDLYRTMVRRMNLQDERIRMILLRDYDEKLCDYCYCRNKVQELEMSEWQKEQEAKQKQNKPNKPIEED